MSNLVAILLTGYDMISISKRFSYIGAKGIRKEMEVEVEVEWWNCQDSSDASHPD